MTEIGQNLPTRPNWQKLAYTADIDPQVAKIGQTTNIGQHGQHCMAHNPQQERNVPMA